MRNRIVAVLLLATIGSACTKSASVARPTPTPSPTSTVIPGSANVDSGASTLRSGLTALLQEHIYLAGIAIGTRVGTGAASPATNGAVAALDLNSVALSRTLDHAYPGSGPTFLSLWRRQIRFLSDYADADGKGPKAAKAKVDLDGFRGDVGAFLEAANPKITRISLARDLAPPNRSLLAAIDAAIAKGPAVAAKLREAASKMPGIAHTIAGALAKQFPVKFDGSESSGASALRAALAGLLQEHVYLGGIAVDSGVKTGAGSPATKAALATLDANAVALSSTFEGIYPDSSATFLPLWRVHVTSLAEYASAKGKGPKAEKAKADLVRFGADLAEFLGTLNPSLAKDDVSEDLARHVSTFLTAADAAISKSPTLFGKLRAAAEHMLVTADVLAGAIVERSPEKFA